MPPRSKKVIFFIVEGPTEETALSSVLKTKFQNDETRFHIVHGDISSDLANSSQTVINRIYSDHLKVEMKRYGLQKKDIKKVVHLVDMDGAFIPPDRIIFNANTNIRYFTDRIESPSPEKIVNRNNRKKSILSRLYSTPKINTIPYSIYYFSRNLEHVLHNIEWDLSDEEKINYADQFENDFGQDLNRFISFISNRDFSAPGTYTDTWLFISEDLNSLQRYCNLHILFQNQETNT